MVEWPCSQVLNILSQQLWYLDILKHPSLHMLLCPKIVRGYSWNSSRSAAAKCSKTVLTLTCASMFEEVMRFDTRVEKPLHRQLLARRPCRPRPAKEPSYSDGSLLPILFLLDTKNAKPQQTAKQHRTCPNLLEFVRAHDLKVSAAIAGVVEVYLAPGLADTVAHVHPGQRQEKIARSNLGLRKPE
jgi:hypothetical protein